jgi:hypothetical protein
MEIKDDQLDSTVELFWTIKAHCQTPPVEELFWTIKAHCQTPQLRDCASSVSKDSHPRWRSIVDGAFKPQSIIQRVEKIGSLQTKSNQ